MNDAMVDLLAPRPFVHYVVRREHPIFDDYRYSCVCGWRSVWAIRGVRHPPEHLIAHPHLIATVSRTDLTRLNHPSNLVAECQQQPASAVGTGPLSSNSGVPVRGRPQSSRQEST